MNKRKQNNGSSLILNGINALLLFGLITGLTACDDRVISDNKDKQERIEDIKERPEYDDMTELVRYSPFSKNNNNFLVINPETYPKASAFRIEVQASEEMEDGDYEFVTIWKSRITPEKPYVQIPDEFNTKKEVKYALMLTVLDAAGSAMAQGPLPTSIGPLSLMEPAPPIYFYSMVTCNGPDYAYNLASFTDHENNPTKYKIEMLNQKYSPEPLETDDLEVQFYQYMSETQFTAWEQVNQPVAHGGGNPVYPVDVLFPGELPPGDYYDNQNNVVQGSVYAVEKDFGPWKGGTGEDALSSPYIPHSNYSNWNGYGANFSFNNDQDLIYFSSKINSDIIPEDSRYGTNLVCKQVNSNGSHYGGVGSGTSPVAAEASFIFRDCLGNIISSADGSANENSDNVIDITNCGDEGQDEGIDYGDGVFSFNFEKIDEYARTKPITLYPERFKEEGYFYSLEEGLYNVKVVTEDQMVVRYLKRVNKDQEFSYEPARGAK